MSQVQHTITHLVVHKLHRAGESPASAELRDGACRVDDAAVRLVERLCGHYADRSSRGYGRFAEEAETDTPLPRLVREYVVDKSLDFAAVSQRMMDALRLCADEEGAEVTGHVVIARILEGASDCLWIAVVGEAVGSAVTGALDIVDCLHLDFSVLPAVGRIDLTGWQRGDERYISFLKGRGDVAPWFKRFLGCGDVVIALKETKKLVQRLSDFADTQRLEAPARDAMLERAHGYLDELGEAGSPLALDEIARKVWPEQPERLDAVLSSGEAPLASGFVPDRRAIRPLVRFRAAGEQWKLEFDRSSLHSGAVHYDRASDTLVLSGLPEYLKKMLQEE
ncbi:Nucleoid-associated protein YejK [Azoarcus sp. Aa7]|nr:Nucleoid-associated protein YejK [Azoarcus sp. Aa7]